MVEHRRDGGDLFAAIQEAMAALRTELPPDPSPNEARREAWMRQSVRAAQKARFHKYCRGLRRMARAPALTDLAGAKADAALLKGLPKIAVPTTWVPWTHGRLAYQSGYGAWDRVARLVRAYLANGEAGHSTGELVTRWLARVARLLREQDLDISSAHVIEGVRLAEALAALRERPLPGLAELNEAVQAVFCFGSALPVTADPRAADRRRGAWRRARRDSAGAVAARPGARAEAPAPAGRASWRDYDLDLRKPNDLARSHLLHRLKVCWPSWGDLLRGSDKGTFHERWRVQWRPELTVALIEAGVWGNTIADAANAYTRAAAERAADLPALTELVNRALLAELPSVIGFLMQQLQDEPRAPAILRT